jgi:hypothetical protein
MKLEYHLLIAETPLPRNEHINLGIAVWRDGMPEFHVDASINRLSALDPNYPRLPIFRQLMDDSLASSLATQLAALPDQAARFTLLEFMLAPMRLIPGGELFAAEGDFTSVIDRLMAALVRRPALSVKAERRPVRNTKLTRQLKDWFRQAKVMGRNMDDLSRSRIVEQYPVSVESDVYADFAYKNGHLHVIETLDLRGADHITPSLRNNAAFKSITLDMARDVVGQGKCIGVVAVSNYANVKSAVRLFERNADELYSLESPADVQRLSDFLASGLHIDGGLLSPGLLVP